MTRTTARLTEGWRALDARARLHLFMVGGLMATTVVVWACADPRALLLYALYFVIAGMCYE